MFSLGNISSCLYNSIYGFQPCHYKLQKHQLTMSGLFNGWIQGHQEITCDSVDCLPRANLGVFLPNIEKGDILPFWRKSSKSPFSHAHCMPSLMLFTMVRNLIWVSQLNFSNSSFCDSPFSIEFLSSISNRSCGKTESHSHNGATCFSGWTGYACTVGPNSVPFFSEKS